MFSDVYSETYVLGENEETIIGHIPPVGQTAQDFFLEQHRQKMREIGTGMVIVVSAIPVVALGGVHLGLASLRGLRAVDAFATSLSASQKRFAVRKFFEFIAGGVELPDDFGPRDTGIPEIEIPDPRIHNPGPIPTKFE